MHRRPRFILATSAAALVLWAGAATAGPAVHPQLWPKAQSRGLIDPAAEARITALMAAMSVVLPVPA